MDATCKAAFLLDSSISEVHIIFNMFVTYSHFEPFCKLLGGGGPSTN